MKLVAPFLAAIALPLLWAPTSVYADTKLIPLPASMQVLPGAPFRLTSNAVLVASGAAATEAQTLAMQLRAATGFALPIKASGVAAITLVLAPALQGALGKEGYKLESSSRGVRIVAANSAGLFYGGQTLRQLLPPQAAASKPTKGINWDVPAVSIEDKPRFAWRGFLLDDARHFFGVEYVKHLLDNMAARKLNVFHWHLTDDEGWRMEIKALPKLTEVGAWRGSETALPNVREETHTRYGGFYTQEQIRDIIAYAKARHIDIMPEVDLPGHALALITAYPEAAPKVSGEGVSAQGFTSNVISPTRPEALAIVDKVYDEIAALFPFEYIHIGGDEVNHDAWSKDPQIKEVMAQGNIKNLHEVQMAFTKRLEGVVARHGKKLFGWNEVMDDRLSRGTGIMSWTGAGPGYDAAKRGFPVVMIPGGYSYLDMGYGGAVGEPQSHWWAGDVTIPRIYSFDPLADSNNLTTAEKERIRGVQAGMWAEFVRPWKGEVVSIDNYWQAADYKIWPRLLATCEVAWTPQQKRNFDDFSSRLDADEYQRLAFANTFFRVPVPDAVTLKAGVVQINVPFANAEVRYTFDGTIPTATSPRYSKPFVLDGRDAGRLRVRTFFDGRGSTLVVGAKAEPIGSWKEGQLKAEPVDLSYDATGNLASGGVWRAVFRRTGGDKPLRLDKMVLLINGSPVAQAGLAEIQNKGDRAVAKFTVPAVAANAKVSVIATLAAPEGDNVRGNITLVKSERLEPALTVTSPYEAYQSNTAAMAGDWDDDTLFWIAGYPKSGVLATWELGEPVRVRRISLASGARDGTKDQLLGGDLEISEDGATFRKVAPFTYGSAEAEFANPTKIKALRVVANQEQKTWVMLRDPLLR
ncbi:hypothetical protein EON83_11485 [bacterium]|nr:MAG: hypothetical protein EON83_11485 [bacterium]